MKSVNNICNEIRYWVNQYHQAKDSASIDGLLTIQDEIAIRTFTLAQHVADYKTSYNSSYFMRRIGIAKSTLQHQKAGMKIGTSDNQALIDNEKMYEQEQAHEATAVTLDLLLKQTNIILQSIQQRISFYKQEKLLTSKQNQT
jgi:hypothetical protein